MSTIDRIFKETVERVARKQVRAQTQVLRKASGLYRKSIADLFARMKEMERKLDQLHKRLPSAAPGAGGFETDKLRFSAKGLQSQRKRLGLSATECGLLVGVSGRTIGKWERGEARPEGEQLAAVAALRRMGKRAARMQAEELAGKQG